MADPRPELARVVGQWPSGHAGCYCIPPNAVALLGLCLGCGAAGPALPCVRENCVYLELASGEGGIRVAVDEETTAGNLETAFALTQGWKHQSARLLIDRKLAATTKVLSFASAGDVLLVGFADAPSHWDVARGVLEMLAPARPRVYVHDYSPTVLTVSPGTSYGIATIGIADVPAVLWRVNHLDKVAINLRGGYGTECSIAKWQWGLLGCLCGNRWLEHLSVVWAGLAGEIPTQVGDLSQLKVLELWYNNLSGRIPSEIGRLASLERLGLQGNILTGSLPPEVARLPKLQVLTLDAKFTLPPGRCWGPVGAPGSGTMSKRR